MARVTNVYLVRWSQGWIEVTHPASIAAHGRREEFFSAGNANSQEEAIRLATILLDENAVEKDIQSIDIEPTGAGDVPYDDYTVGDTVTSPDKTGTGVSKRVSRIAVSCDNEGRAFYRQEFED